MKIRVLSVIVCVMAAVNFASADTIRGIGMDFVTIGNAGNAADTGGTVGRGAVSYSYRIGKYEVTNAQWNAFVTAAGAPTGSDSGYSYSAQFTGAQQPTNMVSWYETLQFCNYLTSGDKSKGVYQFSGDNTNPGYFQSIDRDTAKAAYGTIYFLPTEDEWYKAAYYKPDASGYSLYANGQNTVPAADNGWNFDGGSYSTPWDIGTGTQEQNGTFDMMGNVWEWNETLYSSLYSYCVVRGGSYDNSSSYSASSLRANGNPESEGAYLGFRVATVPEPATILLLTLGGLLLRKKH
ncbi:MAG: SUMF1/EgtB/PvdO family nonheme iron enzyme [Sedimentisphaerales bacterium]